MHHFDIENYLYRYRNGLGWIKVSLMHSELGWIMPRSTTWWVTSASVVKNQLIFICVLGKGDGQSQ